MTEDGEPGPESSSVRGKNWGVGRALTLSMPSPCSLQLGPIVACLLTLHQDSRPPRNEREGSFDGFRRLEHLPEIKLDQRTTGKTQACEGVGGPAYGLHVLLLVTA